MTLLKTLVLLAILSSVAFALPQAVAWTTTAAPCWTSTYPLIAVPWDTTGSHTNKLVATGSTGTGLTYLWTITAGPNSPTITSATSATTTVTGVVAGQYTAHLVVTDSVMATSAVDLTIGAIGINANGIVIPTDTSVTEIFGSIIALGYNPWCWEDERNLTAQQLQYGVLSTPNPYNAYTDLNQSWMNDQTGTVTYVWNGVGNTSGSTNATTLSVGINATTLTITVADATKLNLTEFPTRVTISAALNLFQAEEIRICSAVGNTLTACYDGRGVGNNGSSAYLVVAQSWSIGAIVGQSVIKGSGTSFLGVMNPAGASAPSGPVTYSTGTVAISGTTITGSGTSWSNGNDVYIGDAIVISAAHSSSSFLVVRYVTAVSTTSITVNVAVPTVDTSTGLSYKIVRPFYRLFVAHMTRPAPYAGDTLVNWGTTGCESNTECFYYYVTVIGHDNATLNGTTQSGVNWTYQDNTNGFPASVGFYGPALAWRAFYYRSGIQQPLDMANALDSEYVKFPGFAGAGSYGSPLYTGGGIISASSSYHLTGSPSVDNLRPWWNNQSGNADVACNSSDTRDRAYTGTWSILGALYDPDVSMGGWRETFRTIATSINSRDNLCSNTTGGTGVFVNSWANGFYFNTVGSAITITNGTTAGTGTGIPSTACNGVDIITVTVTAGLASVSTSGTFTAGVNAIMLGGRYYMFTRTNATTGSISALWPGSSGPVSGMTLHLLDLGAGTDFNNVLGQSNNDTAIQNNYACLWNNSGSITLDRNFIGTTGVNYLYTSNVAGLGQQPFMMGIQAVKMKYGARLDSALSLNNATLLSATSAWVAAYGVDPQTNGMYYFRACGSCESGGNSTATFAYTTPGTRYGLNSTPDQAIQASRELNAEAGLALIDWFIENPTQANRDLVDYAYGGIWGKTGYDDPSVAAFTDSNTCGNTSGNCNISNAYLSLAKWPGFFFGMGMGHQWPAVRLTTVILPAGVVGGRAKRGRTAK